jgi:nicotinamidase/pyrazinamidase
MHHFPVNTDTAGTRFALPIAAAAFCIRRMSRESIHMHRSRIQADDALIIVDVQKDFCSGGALPIQGADDVVPVLNEWIDAACASGARIIFSRDWHPPNHVSFHQQGGPWPPHCVQKSSGAEFHAQLKMPREVQIVSKGTAPDRTTTRTCGTDLAAQLRMHGGGVYG